jgi:DNA-binding NarL/FixJ family response regulator/REP element-mobilizing transposase RayT
MRMINLLVVTSDISFGEQLRQSLEKLERFRVCVVRGNGPSVAFIKEVDCPLVFLDTGLTENDLLETGLEMRQANPNIRFVVISEAGWHSALEELSPDGYLTKPFHLPDLLGMMDSLFPNPQSPDAVTSESVNDPPWLSDVTRAAQHLTRLTLESSAQAALITRDDQLWAYAGGLPQSATRELTDTVSRYWDRQKENDLVRFVHLASTGAEHMLYATRLTKYMVLALIFDAETPFSTIHTQANQLVHSLSTSPSEKQNNAAQTDNEVPSVLPSASFSGTPASNPKVEAKTPALKFLKESNQTLSTEPMALAGEAEPFIDVEKPVEAPAATRKSIFSRNVVAQDDSDGMRPNPIGESARKIILEPISPAVYNLDYACLLVPRFPSHHLIGDLSDHLQEWLQETCIAFGWRLEYISVRPEYLLWNINVPPASSPAYLMRIMRQRISVKIFDDFPRFKKENPSGDFFAPGYLIMGGSQPVPIEVVKEFIAQTRQRQGISQPPR